MNNRIGECIGPYCVISMDSNKMLVFVQDVKVGAARPFSLNQVKRYHNSGNVAEALFDDIHHGLSHFASPEED